jgi:hypothetical protein
MQRALQPWQLLLRRAMSAEALTAAPAEAVEAVPAALQQRTVSDTTWAAQHRQPSAEANTTFKTNTTGFAKPFVLPARLDRGVDILHDPVFNKVPCRCTCGCPGAPSQARHVHDTLPPRYPTQGTGFPLAERDRLGLRGLVPPREMQLHDQAQKARCSAERRGGVSTQPW